MRRFPSWGWALMTAIGVSIPALADEPPKPTPSPTEANPAVPAPGHSVHGEAFNEGPRQKAHLMPGMGKADFPATVSHPEAQAFLNQGVAQLHSFYYLEAERSFRQAAKIDPACPIAYWGMAMANTNNDKRAKAFLKEAQKRAEGTKITPRERLYLDALAALYKDKSDDKSRRQGWLKGLETIVQEFPGDLDARTWLAMVTWQNSGKDGIGSRQAVDTLLDSVLQVEPMNPGALHYRIHLWDHNKAIRAEKAAALYGNAAPGIAHAWHMPGHTYTELKRYADAAYQQEASARVDHASMLCERTMPFEIHNYAHNNQWLVTSLSHVGRVRDGLAVARNLVEQPRDPQHNGPNDGGSAQRNGRERWVDVLTRYELWDDLMDAIHRGVLDFSDIPFERKQRAYALGLVYAAKGDRDKLAEQVAVLKDLVPPEGKKGEKSGESSKDSKKDQATKKPSDPGAPAALAELEGYQKLLDGQAEAAMERFGKASAMRAEARARAYLALNQPDKAVSAAREAVEKNPGEFPPLACLVEVLQATGKTGDAQDAYRKLQLIGRQADGDTPVARRLATIVEGWKTAGQWTASAGATATEEATAGRVNLLDLGPLVWSPYPAEPLAGTDTEGMPWSLEAHKGSKVIVLFYLGGKCAHCMQQLQEFGKAAEDFKRLNTLLVAVSTDDLEATKALKNNTESVKFPMPMLADPTKALFRSYRAYDDFEDQALHGTFLIDGRGGVRFHRIGPDPYLDVEFLKSEAARIDKIQP